MLYDGIICMGIPRTNNLSPILPFKDRLCSTKDQPSLDLVAKTKLTYNAKDDFIFDQQTPEKKKKPQTKVRSRHSTAEKSEDEWSKVSEGFEGLDPLAWEQTKSRKKQKSRHSLTRVTSIGNTESPVKSQPSIHWDSSEGEEDTAGTTTHTVSHQEIHRSTHIQPHNVKSPSKKTASNIVKKYLKHSAHKLPRGSKTSNNNSDRNKAAAARTSRDNTAATAACSSSFQQYWQSLLQEGDSQEREKPLISSVGSISQYDSDNEDQLLHTGCNGHDCEICQLIKSQRQGTNSANISPTSSPLITNPLKVTTSAGKITASIFASKIQQTLGGSPERASEGDTGDGDEAEGLLVDSAKKKKKNKFIKEGLAERLTRLRAREKSAFTFWTHKLNQNKITDLSKVLTVHVLETTVNHSVLECRCISVSDQTKDKNLTVLFTGQLVDKIQEGAIVRIYPPWQKLTLGGDREVILCTQLSQVVGKKSPDKVTKQQQQPGTRWIKFGSWKCPCSEEGSVVPVTDCPADSVQDLHQQTAISTQSQELFPDSGDSGTPHDLETVRISQSNISPLAKLPDILTSIENRGHLVQTVQFLAKVRRVFCRKVLHVGNRVKSVGSSTQKLQHGFLAQDRKGVICEVLLPDGWERQQEWVVLMEEGEGRVYTFTGLKVVHRTNRAKHSALFSMLDSLWSPTQYSQDTEDSFNETDAKQTPIFCYILKAVLGESHCGLNNTEIPTTDRQMVGGSSEIPTPDRQMVGGSSEIPTPDRQMVGGSSEIPTLDRQMVKGSSLNVGPGRVSFEGKVVYSWHKTVNDADTTVTYVCVQSGQVCPIHHTATFHCPLPVGQGRVVRVVDALVQKEGKIVLDGYSAVQEVSPPPHVSTTHLNIPDCSTDVKMYDLVKIQGSVSGVDEESAYMWSCCDRCHSDKLVGGASENAVLTCTQCKMAVTEPLTKMKLQVFVSTGDITAKIQLQQNTIECLLPEEDAPDEVHFEEKEGRRCALAQCYSQYLKLCVREEINNALAEFEFYKLMKKTYPNGFGLTENSPLKGEIRETKHTVVKNKVKADTLKLKTKDVIKQAFEGLNNPCEGIMFNTLKRYMIGKFPALQLDTRPKTLLRGLEMGLYHGYVELLRGVGRAGRYRWYDPEKHEAEEKEKKKKKKQEGKGEEDGKKKEEGEGAESAEEAGGDKEQSGSGGDGEGGKDESAEDSSQAEDKKKKTTKKKKPAKKGKAKPKKKSSKFIVHSAPVRMEDTFPLALTFMAEPKEASFTRILNYINKFYDVDLKPEKLQKVLDKGSEKNYWHHVRGNARGSIFQLTVDTFDPTDDDDLIGKVVNAIMASVEPKNCSARALKEYVTEFHPDYKVAERPHLFKRALERACTKQLLRQITGIGASGTFQLVDSFIPSPVVLAGKDTASDYEESSEESSDEGMISDHHEIDISQFLDAYKPRPTKRRGKVREVTKMGSFDKNAAYVEAQVKQQKSRTHHSGKPKKRSAGSSKLKVPKKKARYDSSDEEQSSADEDSDEIDEIDSTYGSDTAEKYRPRPSSSRGGTPRSKAPPPAKKSAKDKGEKKSSTPAGKKAKAAKKRARSPTPPPPTPKKTPRKAPTQRSEPIPSKGAKKEPPPAIKAKTPAKGKSPAAKGKSPAGKKTPTRRKRN